jgi:hypothetical protein
LTSIQLHGRSYIWVDEHISIVADAIIATISKDDDVVEKDAENDDYGEE